MSLTINDILTFPIFKESKFIAGHGGKNNKVKWVTTLEVLDEISQLNEGELLVTTAFDLLSNNQIKHNLISYLSAQKLAGIVIQTGYYLETIPEKLLIQAEENNFPVIEINKEATFSEITKVIHQNIINSQFEMIKYSEELYSNLTNIALKNQGLQPIANEISKLINGDIKIIDSNFNILHSTSSKDCSILNSFIIDSLSSLRSDFEHSNLSNQSIQKDDNTFTFMPIKSNNNIYGYIAAIKEKGFNEFEKIAIKHASTIYSLEFIKLTSLKEKDEELQADFMETILTRSYHDPLTIYSKAEVLGVKIGSYKTCVAIINIDNYSVINQNKTEIISKLIEKCINKLTEFGLQVLFKNVNEQIILLITNFYPERTNIITCFEKLAENISTDLNLTISVGIGKYYKDLKYFKDSYSEALETLYIIQNVWLLDKIQQYHKLGLYKLFLPLLKEHQTIFQFISETLGEISENEELMETLTTYLDSLKVNDTAEKLFIHRHTLRYRLSKIEEITNKSLTSLQDRMELELALTFYKITKSSAFHVDK